MCCRCGWSHLWLHFRPPCRALGHVEVVRLRVCQCPRMLGSVRLRQPHLDSHRAGQLVTSHRVELRFRRCGFWTQRGVFAAESVRSPFASIVSRLRFYESSRRLRREDLDLLTLCYQQIPRSLSYGCQDVEDPTRCRRRFTCWTSDCDQDSLLCARQPRCEG